MCPVPAVSVLYSTPAGPAARGDQQLIDAGLDDPVADVAIELLPAFVEHEGRTAFDKLPVLGIEVRAQRCVGSATVDVPADAGKGQWHVRDHRVLNASISVTTPTVKQEQVISACNEPRARAPVSWGTWKQVLRAWESSARTVRDPCPLHRALPNG